MAADPIKFCLRFKPPTIALVYSIASHSKGHRKYVHEIKVDLKEGADLHKLCDEIFLKEKNYFNPNKISKQQVSFKTNELFISNY